VRGEKEGKGGEGGNSEDDRADGYTYLVIVIKA
jgi:hypothetical protein